MVLYLEKEQQNKFTTDENVSKLIDLNEEKFAKVPELLNANGRLKNVLGQISALASQKVNATKGTRDAKTAERTKLVKLTLKVSGSLVSLAIQEKDPVTKEKAMVRRRALERMRPEDLKRKATTVYELANARLADLATRGTTVETLAALKAETEVFSKAVANQNLGMGQQTSATKSIPDLFRDADEIIYEDINGLMEHVEGDYPGFFAEFNEVKRIKDLGIRHNPPPAPPQPPAK